MVKPMYDHAKRRRAVRKGRERGCWVYVPAAELEAAGIDPRTPPPAYRLSGHRHSRNTGRVLVNLYREP